MRNDSGNHEATGVARRFFPKACLIVLLLLCFTVWLSPSHAADLPASGPADIIQLAAKAKAAFATRMEPPVVNLSVLNIGTRDKATPFRTYARRSFDAAIDSLVDEGKDPDKAERVRTALRELAETGRTATADTIFAEMVERSREEGDSARRDTAAKLRHSVALKELPAALAALIKAPYEPMPFPHEGTKALPAYRQAAMLDPADSWTWIVLAVIEQKGSTDALARAQEAAVAADDWQALMVSKQILGAKLEHVGAVSDAARNHDEAVSIARARMAAATADPNSRQELARALIWSGALRGHLRNWTQAEAAYQEALEIRKSVAALAPGSVQAKLDLIASYEELFELFEAQGRKDESKAYLNEGFRIYYTLTEPEKYKPTFNVLQQGVLAGILIIAGVLSLLCGGITIVMYRRRVAQFMRAVSTTTAHRRGSSSPVRKESQPLAEKLSLRSLDASSALGKDFRSESIARARKAFGRATWVYAIAGLAFASADVFLWLGLTGTEINFNRFMIMALSFAWPAVLSLVLLWGPDRRRRWLLFLAYFGALLFVCMRVASGTTTPLDLYGVITLPPFFQPLFLWLLYASPSVYLLAFLNRQVRSIGPVVLIFMLFLSCGAIAADLVMSMPVVMRGLASINAALGISVTYSFWLCQLLGMALFAPLGWLAISTISKLYEAKRFSNDTLVFDSIWLFQTVMIGKEIINLAGGRGWVAMGVFVIYILIVWAGLRPLAKAATLRKPVRLLLLRTFGFRGREEKLFDALGATWRYAGPIQMIAAPDLAARLLDPGKFLNFISGRLRRSFLIEPEDLAKRLESLDDQPDPDGKFRVNELFCGSDGWQPAVRSLMERSDVVAMDLRGFTPNNKGCIFELQSLIDIVPAGRIVLLVDATTDISFLRQTLDQCWLSMADASPNRTAVETLTLLNVGRGDVAAVKSLLEIADEALASRSGSTTAMPSDTESRSGADVEPRRMPDEAELQPGQLHSTNNNRGPKGRSGDQL